MDSFTAIFDGGVLRPIQPLDLPANTEVLVTIDVLPQPSLTVSRLNEFLRSLPSLGDDAEDFERDIREFRAELQPSKNPWE